MNHLLNEATDGKAALNSQLKKSDERASQLKQDMTLKRALMGGKSKEGVDNIDKNTGRSAENHSFTMRNTHKGNTQGQFRTKTKLRCRTS